MFYDKIGMRRDIDFKHLINFVLLEIKSHNFFLPENDIKFQSVRQTCRERT